MPSIGDFRVEIKDYYGIGVFIYNRYDELIFKLYPKECSLLPASEIPSYLIAILYRFNPAGKFCKSNYWLDREGTRSHLFWDWKEEKYIFRSIGHYGEFAWLLDLCLEAGLDIPGMEPDQSFK